MLGRRHEILLYASAGPEVSGAELIPCASNGDRLKVFGEDDPSRLPDWPSDSQASLFNANVIKEMRARIDERDLILLTGGSTQAAVSNAFPAHIRCEPGVGYEGIISKFCAFESYAWMHHVYAKQGIKDGRWFDCVIPNYFDPDDFYIASGKKTYLLFLGRLIARKGPHIASQIAGACKMPLVIAGAGGKKVEDKIVTEDDTISNAEYVGPVDISQRAKLLAEAYALICPTTYIEPFGGVAVEAMMAGTPVIAPDWGAFTETIKDGLSGFRFRTLAEAKKAVNNVERLNRKMVQEYAVTKYSLEAVAPQFITWFNRLGSLWGKGWYE